MTKFYNTVPQASTVANQTVEWFGADCQEQFSQNLEKQKPLLKVNGWIDKSVHYTFNSAGFRCDEFTEDPTLMFLGCSHTFGLGIPYDSTWPYLVAKKLGLRNANLGWPGTSNDTAFRLAYYYIPIIKPKMVIFLSPSESRLELVKHDVDSLNFLPSEQTPAVIKHEHASYSNFYQDWLSSDTNLLMNKLKNKLAINMMCVDQQIKFVSMDSTELRRHDLARDLLHVGVRSNFIFSNIVINKLSV
jgi:hypothetical protein